MDSLWFLDNKAIFNEAANVLPGIRVCDLRDFIGIKPHFIDATSEDRCSQAFLKTKSTHGGR